MKQVERLSPTKLQWVSALQTSLTHLFIFIYFRSSKLHPTHSQLFFQSNSSLTLHLPQEHHFHSSGHSMSRGSCTPNLQLNVIGKWYEYTCPMGQFLASKHVAFHHVHYEELPSLFNIHLSNATSMSMQYKSLISISTFYLLP